MHPFAIHTPNLHNEKIWGVIKQAEGYGERRLRRLSHVDDLQLGELFEPLFSKFIT